jgi:hypothetical protein
MRHMHTRVPQGKGNRVDCELAVENAEQVVGGSFGNGQIFPLLRG